MATIGDLDLGGLISKFLGSPSARARQDTEQDPIVEVQALLETVALSFLLKPELVLDFLFQARNGLREVCLTELGIFDFLKEAVLDLNNPEPDLTDVSHLVDAQTALVELDKLSRISTDLQPYNRYEASIGKFLATLKKSVSRKGRRVDGQPVFERTGTEAKEDLLQGLFYLQQSRSEVVRRLALLKGGLPGFLSVDLSRIVASATIAKTRASLKTVSAKLSDGSLSPTVAALNILTGSAALKAIAGTGKPLDPVIETNTFPPRRSIYYRALGPAASATTSAGPWVLPAAPHTLGIETMAGTTFFEVPYTGRSGRPWLLSDPLTEPVVIPLGNGALYFERAVPVVATVTAGASSLTDLATELTANSSGLFEAYVLRDRLLLVGAVGESLALSNFTRIPFAPASVRELLGFGSSLADTVGTLSPANLLALMPTPAGATAEMNSDKLTFTATDTSALSSLVFSGSLAAALALPSEATSLPQYAELVEGGTALDPIAEGVAVGARVLVPADVLGRSLDSAVVGIDGTQLTFAADLPRGLLHVEVTAALAVWWEALAQALSGLSVTSSTDAVQQAFTPLLGTASRAQVADAVGVLEKQRLETKALFDILDAADLQQAQRPDRTLAQNVLSSLEDHGLDRALLLLTQGDLKTFFSLSADVASRSTNLLKSIELLGQSIIPQDSAETSQSDGKAAVGTNQTPLPPVVRY